MPVSGSIIFPWVDDVKGPTEPVFGSDSVIIVAIGDNSDIPVIEVSNAYQMRQQLFSTSFTHCLDSTLHSPQACLISKFNLFLTVSSVSFPSGAAAETIVLRLSILCLSTMGCFANPRIIFNIMQ